MVPPPTTLHVIITDGLMKRIKDLTRGSRNYVADFIGVIGSRTSNNTDSLISDENCLASSGYHAFILNTTKFAGRKPCTVDDELCFLTRVMRMCRLRDVPNHSALQDNARFKTLRRKPWQIQGRVYADRSETISIIEPLWKLITGDFPKLVNNVSCTAIRLNLWRIYLHLVRFLYTMDLRTSPLPTQSPRCPRNPFYDYTKRHLQEMSGRNAE